MRLDTTDDVLAWDTKLLPDLSANESYARFLAGVERILKQAIELKRDVAISTPRFINDLEGYRLESRYILLEPGAVLEDLPGHDRWTLYHTSTDQARALLAQVKQDQDNAKTDRA